MITPSLHTRRRTLVLLLLPFVLIMLACATQHDSGVVSGPRWACPSPQPRPFGPAGPLRSADCCCDEDCTDTDGDGVNDSCTCVDDTCEICRYLIWEQEYPDAPNAPPFPSPTPYALHGLSYVFGQRVEIAPLHVLVTSHAGPTAPDALPGQEPAQVHMIDITWVNETGSPIPMDYATRVRVRSMKRPNGTIESSDQWGVTVEALRLTGIATLPDAIATGETQVSVPVMAIAGTPDVVEIDFATVRGGGSDLRGAPSLSATQIDSILGSYGSPASGTGAIWIEMGLRYGIDPVFGLAFFNKENSLAIDGAHSATTHNIGNIVCAGYPTCRGRWRAYPSWREGIDDWFALIKTSYIDRRGLTTVEQIVPVYAPAFENDVTQYIDRVNRVVALWRGDDSDVARGDLRAPGSSTMTVQWRNAGLQIPGADPCGDAGALTTWGDDGWGSAARPGLAAPDGAGRVVQIALNQVGKPYVFGSTNPPDAFDCSLLMQWSYAQIGISIPRSTFTQWPALMPVTQAQIQPGDLVYFAPPGSSTTTHVGMLVGDLDGDGTWDLVHAANPSLGVRLEHNIFAISYYSGPSCSLCILGFRSART